MAFHQEVNEDRLSYRVIGVAIEVHSELGPGLSEAVYRDVLYEELEKSGLDADRECVVPIEYRDRKVGERYLDLLVEDELVLELKVARSITNKHLNQLGTNLRLANKRRGLVLNFGPPKLGIRRYINSHYCSGGAKERKAES